MRGGRGDDGGRVQGLVGVTMVYGHTATAMHDTEYTPARNRVRMANV